MVVIVLAQSQSQGIEVGRNAQHPRNRDGVERLHDFEVTSRF